MEDRQYDKEHWSRFCGCSGNVVFGSESGECGDCRVPGTGGFVAFGGVGNVGGGCFPVACDSGFVGFNTGELLADGLNVQGLVRQIVQEDVFGNTLSAMLRVTNIIATNNGVGVVNDTFFVVSDIFNVRGGECRSRNCRVLPECGGGGRERDRIHAGANELPFDSDQRAGRTGRFVRTDHGFAVRQLRVLQSDPVLRGGFRE
jgi:hypothetical protein